MQFNLCVCVSLRLNCKLSKEEKSKHVCWGNPFEFMLLVAVMLVHLLTPWRSDPPLLKIERLPGSQLEQPDTVCKTEYACVFVAGDVVLLKES